MPQTVNLDLVAAFLSLAQLYMIAFDYCIKFDAIAGAHIKVQRSAHWSCGTTTCQIGQLVVMCMQLQGYELDYGGGKALDMSYLQVSKESLPRPKLEVSEFTLNWFVPFQHLKEIVLIADKIEMRRPGAVRVQRHDGPKPEDPPVHLLSKILPSGLETICLGTLSAGEAQPWQPQLEHVVSSTIEKFCRLKIVKVSWSPGQKLMEACNRAKIQLVAFDVYEDAQ